MDKLPTGSNVPVDPLLPACSSPFSSSPDPDTTVQPLPAPPATSSITRIPPQVQIFPEDEPVSQEKQQLVQQWADLQLNAQQRKMQMQQQQQQEFMLNSVLPATMAISLPMSMSIPTSISPPTPPMTSYSDPISTVTPSTQFSLSQPMQLDMSLSLPMDMSFMDQGALNPLSTNTPPTSILADNPLPFSEAGASDVSISGSIVVSATAMGITGGVVVDARGISGKGEIPEVPPKQEQQAGSSIVKSESPKEILDPIPVKTELPVINSTASSPLCEDESDLLEDTPSEADNVMSGDRSATESDDRSGDAVDDAMDSGSTGIASERSELWTGLAYVDDESLKTSFDRSFSRELGILRQHMKATRFQWKSMDEYGVTRASNHHHSTNTPSKANFPFKIFTRMTPSFEPQNTIQPHQTFNARTIPVWACQQCRMRGVTDFSKLQCMLCIRQRGMYMTQLQQQAAAASNPMPIPIPITKASASTSDSKPKRSRRWTPKVGEDWACSVCKQTDVTPASKKICTRCYRRQLRERKRQLKQSGVPS